MSYTIALICALAGVLFAQDSLSLDISKLVETVQSVDSTADSLPRADSVPASANKRPALIKLNRPPTGSPVSSQGLTLYLGGGEGSPWFDLGVLEAIEKYEIPVARVVGAGWGAWIGAVWAEGYSLKQIRAWLRQSDSLDAGLFWKSLSRQRPDHELFPLGAAFAEDGFPSLQLRFTRIADASNGGRVAVKTQDVASDSGRAVLARLVLQQPLLELASPSVSTVERIPWQLLQCAETQARFVASPEHPRADLVMASIGMAKDSLVLSADSCGIPDASDLEHFWPNTNWLVVVSWPERGQSFGSPAFRRSLARLSADTSQTRVWVRPHVVHEDSSRRAQFWYRLGSEAMRARLGDLKGMALVQKNWAMRGRSNTSFGTVQPAYDELSPELQNHLSSFWRQSQDWQQEAQNFVDEASRNGLYDSVSIALATQNATDLEDGRNLTVPVLAIRARPAPELSLRVGGMGSTLVGPMAAAALRLRFVQQFEYDLRLFGNYGSWQKTLVPELYFSRIHGGEISFYANVEVQQQRNIQLSSVLSEYVDSPDAWIIQEDRRDANLRVHWTPEPWWILRSGVKIGQSDITTPYTEYLMRLTKRPDRFATVHSMDAFAEWETQERNPSSHFDPAGKHLWSSLGFRSLMIKTSGESNAPLFVHGQVKARQSLSWNNNITLGVNGSAGVEGRSGENGWEYPDSLVVVIGYPTDWAIENRFKMHVNATPFSAMLPIPQLASYHYLQGGGSFGLHQNGNGFWIFASWLRDYSQKNPLELEQDRISIEPMLRLHYRSVEVLWGLHRTLAASKMDRLFGSEEWLAILQIGMSAF